MRIFLDASVILAACGRRTGASAEVFDRHAAERWTLHVNPYVVGEVEENLDQIPGGLTRWPSRRRCLVAVRDVLTVDRPVVFAASKDRPVLFSALAHSDLLLTLDARDFAGLLGTTFYGLPVLKPGDFLRRERETT